ncbi:hypothetical protein ACFO0N_09660 [Halobium salinum]|uniref:Uncharacterized protein n=1 Tax=Halobium salinum TaxID=1364940 RepID=A0ABD5PC28_9EURY|nr:hypothetical protein [Halobium salinum]
MTPLPFYATLLAALGLFMLLVLRYELGVPMLVGVLVVPPLEVAGFGLAYLLHWRLGVPILHSVGLLAVTLIVLTAGYEFWQTGRKANIKRF